MSQEFKNLFKLKIVIDRAIPFIKGVFEPYCHVEYIDGNAFTKSIIEDAEALLVRTRTLCNRELLEGSSVQHIATATIGFDHIDMDYCSQNGIEVSTAAGCNARAVLQWVGAVLTHLSKKEGWQPQDKTLGIVGVGNVGALIKHYATLWGFKVICCDPPRQEREGGEFVSFEDLASKADIITLHVPLDNTTQYLINGQTLKLIAPNCTIINSSRGEVIDTEALLKSGNPFVMDVWEPEPHINCEALKKAIIATPHIAGYSLQGKANASMMAVRNITRALRLPLENWRSETPTIQAEEISWKELQTTIEKRFDIKAESDYLKSHRELFEDIRNNYNYREEYF